MDTNMKTQGEPSLEDIMKDEMSDEEGGSISKLSVDGTRMRGGEKNIEKLLLLVINDSKKFDEVGKHDMDKQEGEQIKNAFDRRIYELDIYRGILSKI
jgi:hypothetical protein